MHSTNRAPLFTFLLILGLLLCLFLRMIEPFIIAVILGAIIALLLNPGFEKLVANGLSRKISALILVLSLSVLILVPLAAFSFLAIRQGIRVGDSIGNNQQISFAAISEKISALPLVDSAIGDQAVIEEKFRANVKTLGLVISRIGLKFIAHLPDFILHTVLALFACLVFLVNGEALSHWFFSKVPIDHDVETSIKISARTTSRSVILSVLAAAVCETIIIFVGFLVLGVPGSIFAAGATFLFSFIPIVSCSPVWLSGALYLYLQGSIAQAFAMIGFGILALIAENLVRPLVLQGSGNMHPLLSLISIFGGLQMFGLFGVVLGPIIAALLVSLLQIWPTVGRRSGITFGEI